MTQLDDKFVFPACAGMNRSRPWRLHRNLSVPRLRGDEPFFVT